MSMMNIHKGMSIDGARLLQLLGCGNSGEVWEALTPEGTAIALKIYKEGKEAKAEYEYAMANSFTNPNLLKPLGISTAGNHTVIRLPYCEGRAVDGIGAHFSERMIWMLIADISNALKDIHSKSYGHFDVKPSNILWNGDKFLLSDFGACTKTNSSQSNDTATDDSSYRFDAPELTTNSCEASDIWSLGATVFYLYMGCHVFNGLGGKAQHKDSPIPFMRKSLPVLSQLVQDCLAIEPQQRPTAERINHIAQQELTKLNAISPVRKLRQAPDLSITGHDTSFWSDNMIFTSSQGISMQ